jgi:parvulin-like peptidyl-prolyl isomerase
VSVADAGSGPVDNQAADEPTSEPLAAVVNGQPITLAAFQRERQRRLLGLEIEPATAAAFDDSVLQTMIEQVLIEQEAERRGIVVKDKEVDDEIALQSTLAAANGQTLEEIVAAQLYTMDEYRDALREMLLTQKVSEVVADVPPYTEQVHSRHILVADEATARALLTQIQQGADFAQLAIEYSLDSSTARTGGDLDWVSRGDLLQKEVEDAIFSLEPGQIYPEPVRSSLGYHIVQTLERVNDRPLSQAALAEKKQQAFLNWLDSQRQSAVIERFVGVGS